MAWEVPGTEQICTLLESLPRLEAATSPQSRAWLERDAKGRLSYRVWNSKLSDEFMQTLYDNGFVLMDFEWSTWEGAGRIAEHPEVLATADLETICKLLTVHARSDRFCEGHFGEVIESGQMLAIVRRLAKIHRSSQRGET
jgi:Family of unknown function (DUF6508)